MPVIKIENLVHTYSVDTPFEHEALKGIDLEIKRGEFLGIIGHTGSGKSTLIQHLNGLLQPTSGKVYVDGEDIWENKKNIRQVRFKVGLVFQYPEYQLFEETVYKDISFGPKNMGLSKEEIDRRVRRAAKFVGLTEDLFEKSPFELSGGQKRRVAIAGVLAMEPQVLVLDEPSAGLDPYGRKMIFKQIQEYREVTGASIVLVTHSMNEIARFVDRLIVMNKGKIQMSGTPGEVFAHAEELKSIGLDVPEITEVCLELKKLGFNISDSIYTIEQAKDALLSLKGGTER